MSDPTYTCPDCGEATEVYSRITGYYRPVQNWNAGKSKEFKDRKLYDVVHSVPHTTPAANHCEVPAEEHAPVDASNARSILFSRATCPNCRVAESMLSKAGFSFEKIIADDNIELAKQYGIKGSPTLVITDGANTEKLYGVPDIKTFLESVRVR